MNELSERAPAQHLRRWIRSLNPEHQMITWHSDVVAGELRAQIETRLYGQPVIVRVEVRADDRRHSE